MYPSLIQPKTSPQTFKTLRYGLTHEATGQFFPLPPHRPHLPACGISVPRPGIGPGPWQQKHRALTTGHQGAPSISPFLEATSVPYADERPPHPSTAHPSAFSNPSHPVSSTPIRVSLSSSVGLQKAVQELHV